MWSQEGGIGISHLHVSRVQVIWMQLQLVLKAQFEKHCPRGWKGSEAGLGQEDCHIPVGKSAGQTTGQKSLSFQVVL